MFCVKATTDYNARMVDRVNAVGIATCYGVIESRWVMSLVLVQTTRGAHPASCKVATGVSFLGKAAGAWRIQPTPSSGEVKERVELYACFPSRPSWHVLQFSLLLCNYGQISWSQGLTVCIATRSFKFYGSVVTSSHEACIFVLILNFISRLLFHHMAKNVFILIFRLYRCLVYL